jgi:integrase
MNCYQRYLKKGDLTYYGRFTAPDPQNPGKTKPYLRNLGTTVKADAEKILKKIAADMRAGRFEIVELTKLRHERQATLGELFTHYRQGARAIEASTVKLNIQALQKMARRVHLQDDAAAPDVDALPLSLLSAQLVRDWKKTVHDQVDAEDAAGTAREQQILRTANSLLRQARSLFTPDLREHYHAAGLRLPDTLRDFCDAASFRNTGKTDYWPPSDTILQKTFTALDALITPAPGLTETSADQRNMYLAIWLALGFGLRKAEIAAAKNDWFILRDNIIFCRGDVLGKNGNVPDVRVQLGAWDKIKPHLRGDAAAHVLEGHHTERSEIVFRRIGEWMERLGWVTQKRIHEFRAFAGSKIAEADGLQAAQAFLRHSSYSTTEKYYMRYRRIRTTEVKLVLPSTPAAAPFQPQIVEKTA